MSKFAEQLKHFRSQKGLSQDDLAEKVFLSRQAISRWENGETSPDLDTLVKLASIFEVTLDELVTGVKPEPVVVENDTHSSKRPIWEFGKMNGWDFLNVHGGLLLIILGVLFWKFFK